VGLKLVETRNRRNATQSDAAQEVPTASRLIPGQHSLDGGSNAILPSDASMQHMPGLENLETSLFPQESLDFPFECDDMWAEMFGTAGMNAQDISYFSQTDC
jgi:hypothetical protein